MNQMGMGGFDLSGAASMTCDKCGHMYFETAFIVKKVSATTSPTGQEGIIPIPVFTCKSCGHINDELAPTDEKLKQATVAVPNNRG